jgi:hypothetical protein
VPDIKFLKTTVPPMLMSNFATLKIAYLVPYMFMKSSSKLSMFSIETPCGYWRTSVEFPYLELFAVIYNL